MDDGAARTLDQLTPRQRDYCLLIVQGYSRDEVAARMGISHRTADHHAEVIYRRTGIHTEHGLAAWVATQTARAGLYQRLRDRLWSVEPHICRHRKYLPAGAVDEICREVLTGRTASRSMV